MAIAVNDSNFEEVVLKSAQFLSWSISGQNGVDHVK